MVQLQNVNSKSLAYDSSLDEYTIMTTPGLSGWGSRVGIVGDTVIVPFNATCEVSFDVYALSNHTLIYDINNSAATGDSWNGNDNDNTQKREYLSGYKTALVANTWTHVKYSYVNDSDLNTNKVDLNVWDYYGIVTTDDTESITYYIRNLTATISGGGRSMDLRLSENTFTQKNVFSASSTVDSSSTEGTITILNGGLVASDNIKGAKVYNVVWNDFVDRIPVDDRCNLEYGCCYCFDGEKYAKSSEYMQPGFIGIHSDTAGFEIGYKGKSKELCCSVAGFVLAYVDKDYRPGTALTCTEDGMLTEMREEDKREWPERIVATYWKDEPSKMWGLGDEKVKVNGRKWVKVR